MSSTFCRCLTSLVVLLCVPTAASAGHTNDSLFLGVTATTDNKYLVLAYDYYSRSEGNFGAGSQVWVKCEDEEWWPAKIHAPTSDLRSFLGPNEDGFAEFYHNPGQLYPIVSHDAETVRPFHARPSDRTDEEIQWMQCPSTQSAIQKALKESGSAAPTSLAPSPSPSADADSWQLPSQGTPFSSDELANIRQLLGAVNATTASHITQQLAREGIHVSADAISRQRGKERADRKRPRHLPDGAGGRRAPALNEPARPLAAAPPPPPPSTVAEAPAGRWSASENGSDSRTPYARGESPEPRRVGTESEGSASRSSTTHSSTPADGFVAPAEEEVLDVIRVEAFENRGKYVLSPIYRFLDLLGAVSVENESLYTALPAPQAVREVPAGGFEKNRRVLLVPLSNDYNHTMGWMRPLEMDGATLSMELEVNGVSLPVPTNWNVAAAKEVNAVKTAPVCDITELALTSPTAADLISVHVRFLNVPLDMELWVGVLACVFVEELELPQLAEQIVSNYTPARYSPQRLAADSSAGVAATSGTVSIVCPISAQVMSTPVRSVTCQHLQCMDLMSVLATCSRTNVWNCALCGEPITPDKVLVNYRLRDWLVANRQHLARVKAVLETPTGQPLRAQYRVESHAETVDIDD